MVRGKEKAYEICSLCCVLSAGTAAACALLLAGAARAETEDWEPEAGGLEGSWTVKVTQHNCETGDPVGEPFLSLLTFSRGGTLVETTSNPMFFPAVRGAGHGVWSATGRQTYRALSIAFITLERGAGEDTDNHAEDRDGSRPQYI